LSGKPGVKPAEGTTKVGPFQQIRRAIETELQKQRQLQEQQAQRKLTRPQPAAQKVAIKTEPATQIPALEPVEEAKLTRPAARVQTKFQELPDFTSKTVQKLKDMRIDAPSEIPQAKHLAEILLDYSDPDELKRAILHYEILGRPIALRGPSGSVIGL
jgi:HrpA-like RNA helicase